MFTQSFTTTLFTTLLSFYFTFPWKMFSTSPGESVEDWLMFIQQTTKAENTAVKNLKLVLVSHIEVKRHLFGSATYLKSIYATF